MGGALISSSLDPLGAEILDKMPDFALKNPKNFPPAAGWGVRLLTPLKIVRLRRAQGGALINTHRNFSELGRVRLLRGASINISPVL